MTLEEATDNRHGQTFSFPSDSNGISPSQLASKIIEDMADV